MAISEPVAAFGKAELHEVEQRVGPGFRNVFVGFEVSGCGEHRAGIPPLLPARCQEVMKGIHSGLRNVGIGLNVPMAVK
jgi:hypothetical protein